MVSVQRSWLLAGVFILCPSLALAWQECLERPYAERFRCLAGYEVAHAGDSSYETALAESASQIGNPAYAAVVLERIVQRDPANAGARLDLVIVSLAAGDQFSARRHLEILQVMPNPPLVVAEILQRLDRQLNPLDASDNNPRSRPGPRFVGSLAIGHDDNPNFGITADTINLIIDGGPVSLIPANSMMPDPASFALASLQVDYAYSPNGQVQAVMGVRQYDGQSANDSLSASARVKHQVGNKRYIEGVVADFRMRDGLYLTRVGLGGSQHFGQCGCNSAGARLDYMEGSENSLRSTRLRLELETLRQRGPLSLSLYGSLDYHHQPNAEWGDTAGFILGADVFTYRGGFTWMLGVSHSGSYDASAYSPLFGGKRRDLRWQQFKAGVSYSLAQRTELFVDWSYMQQQSSILLYDFDRQVATLGIRAGF